MTGVVLGMDLFEEALRRWEEALTFRSKPGDDDEDCGSIKTGAGDAIAEQSMEVITQLENNKNGVICGKTGFTMTSTVYYRGF